MYFLIPLKVFLMFLFGTFYLECLVQLCYHPIYIKCHLFRSLSHIFVIHLDTESNCSSRRIDVTTHRTMRKRSTTELSSACIIREVSLVCLSNLLVMIFSI